MLSKLNDDWFCVIQAVVRTLDLQAARVKTTSEKAGYHSEHNGHRARKGIYKRKKKGLGLT